MDCPKCGKSFDSEQKVKIHYGRAHEGSIAGTEVECHNCGDAFRIHTYRADREDERHFCSQECRSETYSDKVELECEWCGEMFERVRSRVEGVGRHYCSTECKGQAYRDQIELECENCGAKFERARVFVVRYDRHYCSRECMYEHTRGAAHPDYTGTQGLDTAIRRDVGGTTWKLFRKEFHEDRDGEVVCAWCGDGPFEDGRRIDLHHIVPVMAGGTNTDGVVMPLCVGCHRRAEVFTRDLLDYPIAEAAAKAASAD